MRKSKTFSWVLIAALAAPHAAFGTADVPDTSRTAHEVLSDAELGTLWGGEHPVAKIGGDYDYGSLTTRRGDGTCPAGNYLGGVSFVPPTSGVPCPAAIPALIAGEDLVLDIGGDAATLEGHLRPYFEVYVNGVRVPPSQLGPDFLGTCPRISGAWGTATVNGNQVALYACSAGTVGGANANRAVIPNSLLNTGLNAVAVRYRFVESAFAAQGDDTDVRIVFKTGT